jgi:amino acid transporter
MTAPANSPNPSAQPHLKRVLSLWDLVYYGIILTSPIAAVPLFGQAQTLSRGHAVTTLLVAMMAMSVTAVSFGRMANVYPSSGSWNISFSPFKIRSMLSWPFNDLPLESLSASSRQ